MLHFCYVLCCLLHFSTFPLVLFATFLLRSPRVVCYIFADDDDDDDIDDDNSNLPLLMMVTMTIVMISDE